MKLHSMTFAGIGPFRDRVSIDFTALGASGLFLLEGATGSGKSTIIDALVFALYGTVAGGASSKDRIRSDFMTPAEESYVDLFFEVSDGIYRVRRTPAYERANLRSAGKTTRQNATAKLWKLTSPDALEAAIRGDEAAGDIEPVESRPSEVGTRMTQIIGLTHEQFTQTVVLPQGEFARFLRADTAERKDVLERVFGTQFYQAIENQFAATRKDAKRAVEASVARLNAGFVRVLEAAALEEDAHAELLDTVSSWTPASLDTAEAEGARLVAEAGEARDRAAAAEKSRQEEVAAAETASTAARKAVEAVDAKREFEKLVARRAAVEPEATDAEKKLATHSRAEGAFYALAERDRRAERLAALTEAVPAELRGEPESWQKAMDSAVERSEESARKAAELGSLVEIEKGMSRASVLLEEARTTQRAQVETHEKAVAALAERPDKRRALETSRTELAEAADGLETTRAELDTARARHRAAAAVKKAQETLAKGEIAYTAAVRDAREAAQVESKLRQQRLDAMAAEIALDLAPGEPCAVCGSREHPAPATSEEDLVTAEQVAEAEEVRRDREVALAKLSAERVRLETSRDASRAQALGLDSLAEATDEQQDMSIAELVERTRSREQDLTSDLARKTTASQELSNVTASLEKFDDETAALSTVVTDAQIAAERATTAAESAAADLAKNRDLIAAELGSSVEGQSQDHDGDVSEGGEAASSVAAKQRLFAKNATTADALVQNLRAALDAREQHAEQAARAATLIENGEFDDDAHVRAARLPDSTRSTLESVRTQFATLTARVSELRASEELMAVDVSEEAVLAVTEHAEATRVALAAARTAHAEASDRRGAAARLFERLTHAVAAFTTIAEQHRTTTAHQAQIVHLADIATGTSGDVEARLTLSTFAVMRRFEKVVEAANSRLATLSSSNLELKLSGLSASGRRRVGLGLEIIDRYTDKAREPSTLSGGETFFVSLSLALGLADVVTAESGGVQMNTLFIDEGFGSLDPEKLDQVIAEIRHLAQSGRTVGIVSHVSELKNQIAEKIHVRRTADGTSMAQVTV